MDRIGTISCTIMYLAQNSCSNLVSIRKILSLDLTCAEALYPTKHRNKLKLRASTLHALPSFRNNLKPNTITLFFPARSELQIALPLQYEPSFTHFALAVCCVDPTPRTIKRELPSLFVFPFFFLLHAPQRHLQSTLCTWLCWIYLNRSSTFLVPRSLSLIFILSQACTLP